MSDFIIRAIKRGELPLLSERLAQMNAISGEETSDLIEFADWWFFERPANDGVYAGIFDGSKLVGAVGFSIQEITIEGRSTRAAILSSAATDPSYRGRGLFQRLIKHLIDEAGNRGCRAVFGWPNAVALPIYLQKLGFSEMFTPDRYVRPIAWRRLGARWGKAGSFLAGGAGRLFDRLVPISLGSFRVTDLPASEEDWEQFTRDITSHTRCVTARGRDYLRWRSARPKREYVQLRLVDRSGATAAWAMAYLDRTRDRLHVGDFALRGSTPLGALLGGCALVAQDAQLRDVYVITRTKRSGSEWHRLGFLRKPATTPIVGIATRVGELQAFRDWDYRDANVDMF